MKQLFEPVLFQNQQSLVWNYNLYTNDHYKGYYHWHQCCEIMYIHRGQGHIVVNQQMYDIRGGMLFFFQPYQLHRIYSEVSTEKPFHRSIFYIDPYAAEKLLLGFPNRKTIFSALWQGTNDRCGFDLSERAEVMEWMLQSYDCNQQPNGSIHHENVENITMLLLQLVSCLEIGDSTLLPAEQHRSLRYSERMMRWIEEHYHEEIHLEQLAAEMHLSKSYISRLFHQETGSRLVDYLTARRIKQACRLLRTTDLSVEQIGIAVGFPNASYFNQLFRKALGTTPLKYRKNQ